MNGSKLILMSDNPYESPQAGEKPPNRPFQPSRYFVTSPFSIVVVVLLLALIMFQFIGLIINLLTSD